jgi:hypothetical protein
MTLADIRKVASKGRMQPWWERPAKTPGEPHYEAEREHLRAELARARQADLSSRREREQRPWGEAGGSNGSGFGSRQTAV